MFITLYHDLRRRLNPKNILTILDDIDSQAPSYTMSRHAALRRVFITLASVSVCLLLIHYLKYFTTFSHTLAIISELGNHHANYWQQKIYHTGFLRLASYSWWTFWHLIGYVVIPFFIIKYVFKTSFIDMGWRLGECHKHWQGYVLLLSPILFLMIFVSTRQDFLNHYPFYKDAHRSWLDFLCWEVLYLSQFLSLEFFFRGYILNALRPAVGANAVWIMCVPYLMIHFPKPWIEATGAILFGLFLGILAIRSRSIWGGFMVHAGVAVSMDLMSLLRQGKIPSQWWPF